MRVLNNISFRPFNTFGIDEAVEQLWRLESAQELPALADTLASRNHTVSGNASGVATPGHQNPLLLGGGSNLLVTGPLTQPVVKFDFNGVRLIDEKAGRALVEVDAGMNWHDFVMWSLDQGLFGFENLSLIPGTVGASPVQNIGAYGVELKDHLESVQVFDIKAALAGQTTGLVKTLSGEACHFGYRESIFKKKPELWITTVRFTLNKVPQLRLDYGDIRKSLMAEGISSPTPADVARAVIALRRSKLPDPADTGNAGSFFKNPLVSQDTAAELSRAYPGLPVFPGNSGDERKLSAAWMIDHCGLKGLRKGDAGVHPAHALVLVNYGHATGQAILDIARQIQSSVQSRFGIMLEPEPFII